MSFPISFWYTLLRANPSLISTHFARSSMKFCRTCVAGLLCAVIFERASQTSKFVSLDNTPTCHLADFTIVPIFAPTSSILSTTLCAEVVRSVKSPFSFPVRTIFQNSFTFFSVSQTVLIICFGVFPAIVGFRALPASTFGSLSLGIHDTAFSISPVSGFCI